MNEQTRRPSLADKEMVMDNRPERWEFSWIEVPTYTDEAVHEGLRKKLDEEWEPFQVIPMTTASNWWLIFLKRRRRGTAA